jgi:hypothetical protein
MHEIKARLYDIETELEELNSAQKKKIKLLKEEVFSLNDELFLHTKIAVAKEIEVFSNELADICQRILELLEEKKLLKQKLVGG